MTLEIKAEYRWTDLRNLVHNWRTEQLRSPEAIVHSMKRAQVRKPSAAHPTTDPTRRAARQAGHTAGIEQYERPGQKCF
jgi:hypothetical protein